MDMKKQAEALKTALNALESIKGWKPFSDEGDIPTEIHEIAKIAIAEINATLAMTEEEKLEEEIHKAIYNHICPPDQVEIGNIVPSNETPLSMGSSRSEDCYVVYCYQRKAEYSFECEYNKTTKTIVLCKT